MGEINSNAVPQHAANLAAMARSTQIQADRYEANIAGGGSAVQRDAVRAEHVRIEHVDGGLRINCEAIAYHGDVEHISDCPRVVYVEFTPPAAGLPVDWREWAYIELDAVNGPVAMGIELTVLGARSRLLERRNLAPGEEANLVVDLHDLPLTSGILPPYEPQAIRIAFFVPEGGPAGACDLRRLALVGRRVPGPSIDRWGQRIRRDWAGKVRSDADLVRQRDEEAELLAAMKPVQDRGRFGGWTRGPRFAASGFFRVEQDTGGRWWYVDPEGLPFWSNGPTCIRLGDATTIAGREELFAESPQGEPDFVYDEMGRLRFYGLNAWRKYGSVEAWRARMRQRLRRWGCNTIANWSDRLVGGDQLAYVHTLSSRVLTAPSRFGPVPDVFDPEWEPALRTHFRQQTAPVADDPWLIGYFVDNELHWGGLDPAIAEEYAECYFSTIARVLRECDPNHLYMGCRFVRVMPSPVFPRVAGKYVDVLSVNAYSIIPRRREFDAWFEAARRPIQIGEHQFALRDPRGMQTPWMALTADERQAAVVEFSRAGASLPYCIGTHWFQFEDQPATGRPSNGENMLIGLVDITDQPYPHMVQAFRHIAQESFGWHATASDANPAHRP